MYKYECPTKDGYAKIKLTKEEMVTYNIKTKWNIKTVVYKGETDLIVEEFHPLFVKVLQTLLYPILFLLELLIKVLISIRDIGVACYKLWFQKRSGSFMRYTISLDEKEREVMDRVIKSIK